MDSIAIYLREDSGTDRVEEPVRLGIPFPQKKLRNCQELKLFDSVTHSILSFQATPLNRWPDGTVRWLQIEFPANLRANEKRELVLAIGSSVSEVESPLSLIQQPEHLVVNTGNLCVRIDRDAFRWQRTDSNNIALDTTSVTLTDAAGAPCCLKLTEPWMLEEEGPYKFELVSEGYAVTSSGDRLANLRVKLVFCAHAATIECSVRIHNPQRALHPGGLWDLGDPGSIHFKSLTVEASLNDAANGWIKPTPEASPHRTPAEVPLSLYQASSGGPNWDSRNHVNSQGKISIPFRGWQLSLSSRTVLTGERACPIAGLFNDKGGMQASIPLFWQNFPSALSLDGDTLTVGLFPKEEEGAHELQGGERKIQIFYLHYGDNPDALRWTYSPLVPTLSGLQYEEATAFPWFSSNSSARCFTSLIQKGIEGPDNFFAKRELIDEYGWRNFGDLFADHETLYQEAGESPYISHYNNQYDAIYGFARQFALTGDKRWYQLMDDLARHVTDIDIYHTDEDRVEYNHGLFWHTDHYLDAQTATHRTFSCHNETSSTPGQTGGGPASEHCYTSGLLMHYLLTGNRDSRDAVLGLATWMYQSHEGVGGFLEQLLALKKQDLPKLKALLKGHKPLPYRYPFTRATGNYLNALLDAWQTSDDPLWKLRAESVIFQTLHPEDDVTRRNLLNVETGWSYLVLLTSIAKYLHLKENQGEQDTAFEYARQSLNHYTRWMLAHEKPFLSKPDQLEFPNHTWVAQDTRKAMLMFIASRYTSESNESRQYQEKGQEWLHHVCTTLETSAESAFTRVQVILLQNYGPQDFPARPLAPRNESSASPLINAPELRLSTLSWRIVSRVVRGLVRLRPAREKAWLEARMNRP